MFRQMVLGDEMTSPAFIIPTLTVLTIVVAVVLWKLIYVSLQVVGS